MFCSYKSTYENIHWIDWIAIIVYLFKCSFVFCLSEYIYNIIIFSFIFNWLRFFILENPLFVCLMFNVSIDIEWKWLPFILFIHSHLFNITVFIRYLCWALIYCVIEQQIIAQFLYFCYFNRLVFRNVNIFWNWNSWPFSLCIIFEQIQ